MAVADEKCAGNIACDTGPAAADFAGHCRRRKIRRVMIVAKWRGDGAGIQAALAAEGIAAEVMVVRAKVCVFRGESIERSVFDAFSRRFAREGKSWLPEVLYFTDDFACYGAMNAMLTHAVRVPEDVRVATVANRGSLRAYKTSLTRIEYDLRDMGDAAAGILLSYLRSGVFTENAAVRPVFRVGGSFR
jgi:DNA-binding LacI/PurR family transcriptional regulator